jgi:thioredoxin reductase (NADPH)
VKIIHRRNELRAKPQICHEATENPKISMVWDSVVEEVLGDQKVAGIKVRNVKTNEITELKVDGLFIYIGSTGNTSFVEVPVDMDDWGYIKTEKHGETNIPGLFAIGDVRDEPYKQAIIACGHGAQAALSAEKYLKTLG